eukprot:655748-Rhodomonas_salina.1
MSKHRTPGTSGTSVPRGCCARQSVLGCAERSLQSLTVPCTPQYTHCKDLYWREAGRFKVCLTAASLSPVQTCTWLSAG